MTPLAFGPFRFALSLLFAFALVASLRLATASAAVEYTFHDRGGPTVVFESGLGFGMGVWEEIAGKIANASTFAYSRPGYGESSAEALPEGKPRAGADFAPLLYAALQEAGASKPYILVGHSVGGLYALAFAKTYPDSVAGIVLVDARPKHYRALCEAAGLAVCAQAPHENWPAHMQAESAGMAETEAQAPELEDIAPIPVIAIAATAVPSGEQGAIFREKWSKAQRQMVEAAPNAELVFAADAGHNIHLDQPAVVLAAIAKMIERTVEASRRSKAFDPYAATRAYLDSVPQDVRERSDAYFEGGYWLQLWGTLYALAVAFVLLHFGISAKLSTWAEKVSRFNFVHALLYAGQYLIAAFVLSLPWTVYTGFIREHQYALATQTFGPWFTEQLIGLAVTVVLFSLFIAAIYRIIAKAKKTWPLWGAGFAAVFLVVGLAISPVFIAPLFNDYQPLEEGELRDEILSMARANGVSVDEVYWFDASKQTARISANVSGFLGTARIALNDNLLNEGTLPEIKAVMGHEIGHYVSNIIILLVVPLAIVVGLALAFAKHFFPVVLKKWGGKWGVRGIEDPAGFPLLSALVTVFFFVMTPVTNTIVRENERMADIYGLNAAREPDGFATIALKLATYRKLEPSPIEEFIFYDHPSGHNRVLMSMEWKAENLGLLENGETDSDGE